MELMKRGHFAFLPAAIVALTLVQGLDTSRSMAHEDADGVVKQRMQAMKDMGQAMKDLAAMVRRETSYDAERVKANTRTIAGHAGPSMLSLFPEGSNGPPSEARQEVWQDWQDFARLASDLAEKATAMEVAARQDVGSNSSTPMAPAFAALGKVCSACHKSFRQKSK